MNKEKFHIPLPDDQIIQKEIKTIVRAGVKRKESFPSFLLNLYKEIGFRYLFTNPRDGVLITLSVLAVLVFLFLTITEPSNVNETDVYAFVFLISPLLFMALSLYDLFHKKHSATFELEMVTKYNLYQVAAFRMFNFSVISIIVNTVSIVSLVSMFDTLQFFRAFMISTTALFLFSIIFLIVFMKRGSGLTALQVGAGWIGLNIVLSLLNNKAYIHFLMTIPIFIYGIVLVGSTILYLLYLSKLVQTKPAEGVF
ncbi:hypothetical protein ACFFF5_08945 [Lederbergia wuyishanensis]|uniref:Uncharacterized protein n=1 Tax=Lederbergia wuyishanensis TaxID=1347903 RepID=A0ABU0D625_9BACI|nr:hypothetical protein [Lederbergia wuyishanensis]MCJ8008729.1 hypothetical protein [Lederbergia wuyishanensis]MDQ0343850.1 hypothetical protein [Lederbergia wuyishanensis]